MSRTQNLTWQPGRDGRSGRWRKKYRGKVYYFNGGRGKSDREAYDAAVKQWELDKLKIDAEAPRKHHAEYETEIDVWDQVHTWATRYGDLHMAQLAFEKRADLRARIEAPIPKPLSANDRFGALFEPVKITLPDDLFERAASSLAAGEVTHIPYTPITPDRAREIMQELDGSSLRIAKEIWDDRLATQQRRVAIRSHLVEEHIKLFLEQKQQEAARGELSVGRSNVIRLHLDQFKNWLPKDAVLSDIDGQQLRDYHTHLLQQVHRTRKKAEGSKPGQARGISTITAKERLSTVKGFVRWLWEMEAIPALPRILGSKSKSLRIVAESREVVVFDNEEVHRLLKAASGRTKLFVLLMLNCGMTQKDIGDLKKSEVDLKSGRIIRKRSKTDNFESVPTVNYLLWHETAKLLKEFFNQNDGDRALVNGNGTPLWSEQLDAEGNYGKCDNIRTAFFRLTKKLGITKPLKSLKKTSSSKLRDNERFNGIEDLFLGHAPQKMSDKHYTTAPQKLFDAAITWLASEYGFE